MFGLCSVMKLTSHQAASCFRFLRKLRADGRTNMYGAVPYLMKTFNLDRESAFAVVCQWLDQQAQAEPHDCRRLNRAGTRSR
jgi:hypothetical protein